MPTYWEAFAAEAYKKGVRLADYDIIDVLEMFWNWLAHNGHIRDVAAGFRPNPLDRVTEAADGRPE